jgi:hypothetical protein
VTSYDSRSGLTVKTVAFLLRNLKIFSRGRDNHMMPHARMGAVPPATLSAHKTMVDYSPISVISN